MKSKNTLVRLCALALVALATVGSSFAADPTDVAGIVTSAGGLLTSIYPIVIGAVSFGILVSLVKMVRKR